MQIVPVIAAAVSLAVARTSASSARQKAVAAKTAGPRTDIGAKGLRIGDLALVECDDGRDRLARVRGGYRHGRSWRVQLEPPPGDNMTGRYLPQSVPLRAVKAFWRTGRRRR